ncbi:hypothetical protein Tco_0052647, partial [Tanacetum coccineum]
EETHEEIEKVEEIEEAVAHCEPAPRKVTRSELPIVSNYVALCEPSILFPRSLEQHAEEALVYKTMESLKRIKEEIDYRCSMLDQGEPQEIETFVKPNRKRDMDFSSGVKQKVYWCGAILQQKGDGCEFWASCIPYDDQCNRGDFPDNTKKKCYWGCLNDDKRLDVAWEGVSFKDWVRVSHGKVEVTRYTISPKKSYTKDRILGIEEMHRTSANIAAVRAKLLEEMDTEG